MSYFDSWYNLIQHERDVGKEARDIVKNLGKLAEEQYEEYVSDSIAKCGTTIPYSEHRNNALEKVLYMRHEGLYKK